MNIIFLSSSLVRYYSFDAIPKTVQVTPQTAAGSKVATVRILINETILNNTYGLYLYNYLFGISHNNSERSQYRYPSIYPLFKFMPSNNSSNPTSSSNYNLYYNSTDVAELIESSPVYCTVNSHNYIAISFDVFLQSNSLYHLGDHSIYIDVYLDHHYYYYYDYYFFFHSYITTVLNLRVKAGMDNSNNNY